MDTQTLITIGLAALGASIISSIAGYGGFLMIVTLSFFFDIKTSVALSTIFFFFLMINRLYFYRKTIDWEFYRFVLSGIIPFLFLSFYIFDIVNPKVIKYILAVSGSYVILEHFFPLPRVKKFTKLKMFVGGACWGLLGGLSAPGPLKVLMLKWRGLSKEIFIGTGAMISLTALCIRIPAYISMDYLVLDNYWLLIPMGLIATVGTFIGKQILKKLSIKNFEYVVLVPVFLSVVKFLAF